MTNEASSHLKSYRYEIATEKIQLEEMRNFLRARGELLVHLLENPNLVEHESFTALLRALFHLRDELFSEKRLRDDLSPLRDRPIKDIVSSLMEKIEDFSKGAPQADDITMMIIKYFGGA